MHVICQSLSTMVTATTRRGSIPRMCCFISMATRAAWCGTGTGSSAKGVLRPTHHHLNYSPAELIVPVLRIFMIIQAASRGDERQ